jgi:hypothetical protein
MAECFVILALPGNRRAMLPLPGNEREVTAAIRAGAEFVGVAVGAQEVREMMEAEDRQHQIGRMKEGLDWLKRMMEAEGDGD